MSEQEFPVARGAAANNNPPALAQSPQDTQTQRSQAADPNGFDELESETTSEQGASEGSKTTTKRSRLSEFFRSGDVLRRIIILGLLVLFIPKKRLRGVKDRLIIYFGFLIQFTFSILYYLNFNSGIAQSDVSTPSIVQFTNFLPVGTFAVIVTSQL